jgi:hypothetical protein
MGLMMEAVKDAEVEEITRVIDALVSLVVCDIQMVTSIVLAPVEVNFLTLPL